MRKIAISLTGVFVLAGCSSDPQGAATTLIEGELAEQIGLGPLRADCEVPENSEVGSTFTCTATTDDGDRIELMTTFEPDDRIFVQTTNVLLADEVPRVEADAAASLGAETGVDLAPTAVQCPDGAVVLDAADQMRCRITDPTDGTIYEMIVTMRDFDPDAGFQYVFYELGDPIG